jgi:hypothetical protein
MGPTPKWHFVLGFPSGSLEIPKIGTFVALGPIILSKDLRLKWRVKQSYSLCQTLSNSMSHATCTQGNRGNSWLLVVGSQIANLTFGPSFGHNLCLKCPNGSCEPILDIYIPRSFQWYKDHLNPMGLDPYNRSLKVWESIESPSKLQLPKWEFTWECEGSFLHVILHSWKHEMWLLGFLLGSQLCKPFPWSRTQGQGYNIFPSVTPHSLSFLQLCI